MSPSPTFYTQCLLKGEPSGKQVIWVPSEKAKVGTKIRYGTDAKTRAVTWTVTETYATYPAAHVEKYKEFKKLYLPTEPND